MSLTKDQVKTLRARTHELKPVVTVADKGLHEGVINELDRALEDHELIKIKLAIPDREQRKALIAEIETKMKADIVQEIGKVAVFYRVSQKKRKS